MARNQQVKIEDDVQLAPREAIMIANIQKVGALRFYGPGDGAPLGSLTEIPAGEEAPVPAATWDRYKDRKDIKSLCGTKFILGGLANVKASDLNDATAQRATLLVQERQLDDRAAALAQERAEVERMKADFLATQN